VTDSLVMRSDGLDMNVMVMLWSSFVH